MTLEPITAPLSSSTTLSTSIPKNIWQDEVEEDDDDDDDEETNEGGDGGDGSVGLEEWRKYAADLEKARSAKRGSNAQQHETQTRSLARGGSNAQPLWNKDSWAKVIMGTHLVTSSRSQSCLFDPHSV